MASIIVKFKEDGPLICSSSMVTFTGNHVFTKSYGVYYLYQSLIIIVTFFIQRSGCTKSFLVL